MILYVIVQDPGFTSHNIDNTNTVRMNKNILSFFILYKVLKNSINQKTTKYIGWFNQYLKHFLVINGFRHYFICYSKKQEF